MGAHYCLTCGHQLEIRNIGGEERKACPECSYVFWGNYSIGVGALILKDEKMLLVRRSQEPGKGLWTNPGGYIEQHEPIEECIIREVYEETGITSKVNGIVALGISLVISIMFTSYIRWIMLMEFRCRIMWKLMVQAFLVWKRWNQ